jgi:molecular chaperone DnaJ
VPITATEAALGADIEVPLLDTRVHMRVPPGTQSGAVFRIRGKGLPRASGQRGDAHVRAVVEIPAQLDESARRAAEALAEAVPDDAYPRREAFREAARNEALTAAPASKRSSG